MATNPKKAQNYVKSTPNPASSNLVTLTIPKRMHCTANPCAVHFLLQKITLHMHTKIP